MRTVEISKGGHTFQFRSTIPTGMADVHRRLVRADFLRGLSAEDFAVQAGQILGDVNYVHPFRKGAGRTQLQYLKQLCAGAAHPIDLTRLNREPGAWIAASVARHGADYAPMARIIRAAISAD